MEHVIDRTQVHHGWEHRRTPLLAVDESGVGSVGVPLPRAILEPR